MSNINLVGVDGLRRILLREGLNVGKMIGHVISKLDNVTNAARCTKRGLNLLRVRKNKNKKTSLVEN